ncbi:receptor-like protein 7 [Castanea sativa]|uniref:receptor-like protein 7 n=1 Tax=Castanea sativa TaxID=21020 RepID=UPI003F653C4C
MGCLSWKYQVLCLLFFLFHSTPSSFSSSLSSISPCSALLHFNHSLTLDKDASPLLDTFPYYSDYRYYIQMCDNSYPKTASWKEDTDCCSWDGVVCDKTTRHVIGLDLSCSWLNGPIHSNSTLFFLPHLRTLNLAGNCFSDSLISSEFGNFKALTHLNLSFSCFSGKIPYEISHLSSLISLDLSLNNELFIETPVWKRVIHNLTQLRELLLDGKNMSSIRPNSLMNLSSSFTTLSLHRCYLQGKLENNILCLPSIQTLDLGKNENLDLGSLPKCNWSSSSLKVLDLSSISFSRELLDSISNLKYLKVLALDNCNFTGSIPSLLNNLTQITYLALTANSLRGLLPLSLLNLPNLSTLILDNNQLVGPLPNHVSGLLNLNVLSLSSNFLNGTLPSWLFNFPSLVRLNLGGNQFIGEIGEFKSNSLQYLDLGYNKLHGSIPRSLLNLPNLSTLILDNNQLVGPLPNHVSGLLNLNVLSLSSNFLNGTLPSWLFNLPSLVWLNLGGNQFICEISDFKSNSLEYLNLGHNKLQGSIPRSISRFVNLAYLYLSSNNWSVMLELEMISKLKNLYTLDFSNNLVSINNNVTYTLPKLQWLNLSSTNISEFPIFLKTATNLRYLDLSKNIINGQFPRWLGDVGRDSLQFLDLRANLLQGSFPTLSFLSLQYFFVSNNKLTGEIPSLICNASYLDVLDLSHNNLSGIIPKCLAHSKSLSVLDLRMNSLHGTIPTAFSKRNNFRNINLNGNQLEGPLPQSLANCRNLEVLNIGSNKINGTFPYWLEGLINLRVLVIRSNKFQGHIGNPKTKFPFPNLRILDISNNEFNGPLPRKYFKYLKAMTNVDERKVTLKYMGETYYQDSLNVMIKGFYIELVRIQTVFTTIDFSNNSFRGEIPKIIGRLKSLKGLNFSHNNLTSYIPPSFGNLTNLEWLDLSFNKLIGEIPRQLTDIPWLAVLNLSHNQLTGHIPSGKQFDTFDNDSYIENLDLCGFPLSRTCNNLEAKKPPPLTLQQEDNLEPKNGFGWQAVSMGYGCGVIFGMLMGYLMFKFGKPQCIVRMVMLEQHIMLKRLKKNVQRHGGKK